MDRPPADSNHPAPRRLRRGFWWLLTILALGGLWTLTDRGISHTLASQLSDQLGAEVRLGGWKVLGDNRFELTDLVVVGETAGFPYRFIAPRVRVAGAPNEIRRGTIESLSLEGSRLALLVPPKASPEGGAQELPVIGRLDVPGMRIFVCTTEQIGKALSSCGESSAAAAGIVDISFRDIGTEPGGTLALTSPRVEILDFPTTGRLSLDDLELTAELEGGFWSGRASSRRVDAAGPSYTVEVSQPRWTGRYVEGNRWRTEAVSSQAVTLSSGDLALEIPPIEGRGLDIDTTQGAVLELSSALWNRLELRRKASASGDQELGLRFEGLSSAAWRNALRAYSGLELDGALDGSIELSWPSDNSRPIPWNIDLSFSGDAAYVDEGDLDIRLSGPGSFRLGARGETSQKNPADTRATFQGSYDIPGLRRPAGEQIPEELVPTTARWRGAVREAKIHLEDSTWRAALASCRSSAEIELPGLDSKPPLRKIRASCDGPAAETLRFFGMETVDAGPARWHAKTSLSWHGPPLDLRGTVSFRLPERLDLDGFQIADAQITGPLRIRRRSQETSVELGDSALRLDAGPIDSSLLRAAGSISARAGARTDGTIDWRIDRFDLGLSDADRPEEESPQVRLSGRKGADSAALQLIVERLENRPAWVDSLLPTGTDELNAKGRLQLNGDIQWAEDSWAFEGPVNLTGLGLSDSEGSRVLEGLSTEARLTASGRLLADSPLSELRLIGETGGFLLLWQTLFADFEDFRSDFELNLKSTKSETSPPLWSMDGVFRLPHGSELRLELGPGASDFELTADWPDLSAFHEQVVSRLQDDPPFLQSISGAARLRLDGSLSLDPSGSLSDWNARGRLNVDDADFELSSGKLAGLRLDLPLDLRVEDGATSGPDRRGSLSLDASDLFGLSLPPIETQLRVEGDALTLENSLRLDLLGGAVELSRLSFRDLLSSDRFMRSALSLEGLSLERLTAAYGLPTFEGLLEGELPSVSIAGQTLRVEGGGRLELLGGEVEIRDISGSEIFTPFPQFKLSADFRRISLDRLTARFDFGRVTGLLSGTVEDCELFRGIPTAFRAQFRTVEAKGVKQTVDVKAVKNLTILGTGQGSNLFDQGIQRFLSRYRYAALGIAVNLENDVLRLDGLERRGDKELFLRGAFPFGIDIVNARPGQTVSFQTMVERLKALDFERVKIGESETTP